VAVLGTFFGGLLPALNYEPTGIIEGKHSCMLFGVGLSPRPWALLCIKTCGHLIFFPMVPSRYLLSVMGK
jgi:hypothetical protein